MSNQPSAMGQFVMVFFIEFIRLESCLPMVSPNTRKSLRFELGIQFFLQNIVRKVIVSNSDLRAIYRYWMNSFLELRPLPSAMLAEIDVTDDSNCSISL
jgi:hypothetical protein